jgi:hypothetical protein
MPLSSSDIQVRLSGGSSNAAPIASIGGAKSSVSAGSNLFGAVPSGEASAGSTKYRCVYVHNGSGTFEARLLSVWIAANTPSASTTFEIGVGAAAVNGTETAVGAETTAPSGVTFSSPSTEGAALLLGTVPVGQHKALWIKRVVSPGASAIASDNATLTFKCNSLV